MSFPDVLTSLAGMLYAARLSGAGPDTGLGLELAVVTAALLGGNSVGGGRGSVGKALMGAVIVSLLTNGLVRLGLESGASSLVIGLVLMSPSPSTSDGANGAIACWRKSMYRRLYLALPPAPDFARNSSSPYAINDRLREVEIIGLGEVDGPEDVILDEDDHLYCGVRHGEIVRFLAPDYRNGKSTLMSAVGRSAWPSTARAASSSVSPAWASIASTETVMSGS